MEGNKQISPSLHSTERKQQPIGIVARLMQDMVNIQEVDDVFFWLAKAITQHLNIDVTQFWAAQLDHEYQLRIEVRAASNQDPTLAQQIHINRQVASIIERFLNERRGTTSQPVNQVFPVAQANMLAQYNLHYWAAYFFKHDELLPPRDPAVPELIPTPLTMVVSFFTQHPLMQEQERAINFILEQALRMIVNRKLLISPNVLTTEKTTTQTAPQTLARLIPRKAQNLADLHADNPFSAASVIHDKNARRLYSVVNGRRNVTELAQHLNLILKEVYQALHYLYQEGKIEFITPEGELVEGSQFLPPLQ
jgi:hypothetical protein